MTIFKIDSIDHIVLRTHHIEKMVIFYCDILGCKIEKIQDDIGLTQLRAGDNIIDLIKIDHQLAEADKNLEHFCLRINPFNYDELKKYFFEKNIEILRYANRYGAQGYDWSFYIRDPENNEVELVAVRK